jgi:hypothetical protein
VKLITIIVLNVLVIESKPLHLVHVTIIIMNYKDYVKYVLIDVLIVLEMKIIVLPVLLTLIEL